MSIKQASASPGPAKYGANPSSLSSSGKFHIGERKRSHSTIPKFSTPAPNSLNIMDTFKKYCPSTPGFRIGSSLRTTFGAPKDKRNMPGPGAYDFHPHEKTSG